MYLGAKCPPLQLRDMRFMMEKMVIRCNRPMHLSDLWPEIMGVGYFLYTSIFVDEYAWVPAVSVSTRPKTKQVNVQFNKN